MRPRMPIMAARPLLSSIARFCNCSSGDALHLNRPLRKSPGYSPLPLSAKTKCTGHSQIDEELFSWNGCQCFEASGDVFVARQAETGRGGDVSDHSQHGNASVLDFHKAKTIKAGLVYTITKVEGIPAVEGTRSLLAQNPCKRDAKKYCYCRCTHQ
jgi:hypothetical protein